MKAIIIFLIFLVADLSNLKGQILLKFNNDSICIQKKGNFKKNIRITVTNNTDGNYYIPNFYIDRTIFIDYNENRDKNLCKLEYFLLDKNNNYLDRFPMITMVLNGKSKLSRIEKKAIRELNEQDLEVKANGKVELSMKIDFSGYDLEEGFYKLVLVYFSCPIYKSTYFQKRNIELSKFKLPNINYVSDSLNVKVIPR